MELDFPDDDSVLLNGERYVTARKLSEHYGFSVKQIVRLALESKVNFSAAFGMSANVR